MLPILKIKNKLKVVIISQVKISKALNGTTPLRLNKIKTKKKINF